MSTESEAVWGRRGALWGEEGSVGEVASGVGSVVAVPAPPDDRRWLALAVQLAGRCPPSTSAFAVGAVLVDAGGTVLATGHSREADPVAHAEESALAKVSGAVDLRAATLYSSLEPCSRRASRALSCTDLILAAGIGRVVVAWREPPLFVADARGCELLAARGVEVVELPEFAAGAREPNAHLFR
jgi:diaminohydroxyphosphoribosylaminopyrimidine deaminase/5-amino-6-(5-phosphoribosylamino)uracil reductase